MYLNKLIQCRYHYLMETTYKSWCNIDGFCLNVCYCLFQLSNSFSWERSLVHTTGRLYFDKSEYLFLLMISRLVILDHFFLFKWYVFSDTCLWLKRRFSKYDTQWCEVIFWIWSNLMDFKTRWNKGYILNQSPYD